jgi:hypothetical protein
MPLGLRGEPDRGAAADAGSLAARGRDRGTPARRRRIRAVLPGALLVAGFVVLGIAVARRANVALPRPEARSC